MQKQDIIRIVILFYFIHSDYFIGHYETFSRYHSDDESLLRSEMHSTPNNCVDSSSSAKGNRYNLTHDVGWIHQIVEHGNISEIYWTNDHFVDIRPDPICHVYHCDYLFVSMKLMLYLYPKYNDCIST